MLSLQLDVQPATESLLNLRLDLKKFESQYQMPSDIFYHQFEQGLIDDHEDFMLWSGLYEMLQDNQQRLQELQ